jgi:hypothetical protein
MGGSADTELPLLAHPFRWTFDWSGSETGPSAYDGFPPILLKNSEF